MKSHINWRKRSLRVPVPFVKLLAHTKFSYKNPDNDDFDETDVWIKLPPEGGIVSNRLVMDAEFGCVYEEASNPHVYVLTNDDCTVTMTW